MADIFISYKKYVSYKFVIKLKYDKIITTLGNLFKKSDLTKIEFLFANNVLQLLQYNFDKYGDTSLFKFHLIHEIKKND